MLRLVAILLMTCALVSSAHARDKAKSAIDQARQDIEVAKKSPSVLAVTAKSCLAASVGTR